jgi:hypothetical protein
VSILLNILLLIAAFLALLLFAVVVVPFRGQAAGELTEDTLGGTATGSWCFGLMGISASSERGVFFSLFGRPIWHIRADDKEKKEEKRQKKKAKRSSKKTFRQWAAWFVDNASTLRGLAGRVLGTFKVRMRLAGKVGLADPADTAILIALLRLISQVADAVQIEVQPDYLDDRLELVGEVSGQVWLLAILWVAFSSLFEVRTWKLLRGLT